MEFYGRLGFHEERRIERGYDTVVLMSGNGIDLELFIDPTHPARATDPENLGLRHFALTVDDLDEMARQFGNADISTGWQGERYCFITDPDGLPIVLRE